MRTGTEALHYNSNDGAEFDGIATPPSLAARNDAAGNGRDCFVASLLNRFGFQVSGFGFQVSGFGFQVSGFGKAPCMAVYGPVWPILGSSSQS
jgi:hypothetical protein